MSQSRFELPARRHDIFSYSVALLIFFFATWYWSDSTDHGDGWSRLRLVATVFWCSHFSRRILECVWLHRYAQRRIPLGDALGEYVFYWGFGFWIANDLRSNPALLTDSLGVIGIALFVMGEVGNHWAHWKLRSLRRPGTSERNIPHGGLFNWVSCANYSYEVLSWTGFALLCRALPSTLYALGIAAVLAFWASRRHRRYHELFDGRDGRPSYPATRRALVPFVF